MTSNTLRAAGWYHAAGAGLAAWLAVPHPTWAMLAAAAVVPVHRQITDWAPDEPWRSGVLAIAALAAVGFWAGLPAVGAWSVVVVALAAGAALVPGPARRRPDAWDAGIALSAGLAAVGAGFAGVGAGAAVPAVIAALAARVAVGTAVGQRGDRRTSAVTPFGPPTREIRGTLSLTGALVDRQGTARTLPLDLEVRAGVSAAVIADDPAQVEALGNALAGRRPPHEGGLVVDATPVGPDDRVVAVVAPGEPFLAGSLERTLGALTATGHLTPGQRAAVFESCGLDDVERELDGRELAEDGAPLSSYHRLLVLAGRVIPSHYRVVLVLDPGPWVNSVYSGIWRNAVVRASVGRTAVWVTRDPGLAARADVRFELRHGALRHVGDDVQGGA